MLHRRLLVVMCFWVCVWGCRPASRTPDIAELQQRTMVVMLGTGTPNADPARHGPALAVVVKETAYLVDCGPGVVRRAAAAHRAGVKALAVAKLNTAFLTHLHSDHTAGYPDLILTPWVLGRRKPLRVVGPAGTKAMTRKILEAYDEDIRTRLDGLEPANDTGHRVHVVESRPGVVHREGNVTVRAFAARHGAWKHALGYRFETPDAHICISGDTSPYPEMAETYKGCDVLVHEVYSTAGFTRRPERWRRYHAASHTSTVQLGRIASRIKPGLVVLTHQLLWGAQESELLREIASHYKGPVISARDLQVIGLAPRFKHGATGRAAFRVVQLSP